jgi:branched-chain amino acid transport system substrate-binding protein
MAALGKLYGVKSPADVMAPVGTANAYDAMQLLALAIEKAKSTDGDAVRQALEQVESYDGLIKKYKNPFGTPAHEALSPEDYVMVRYDGGKITPVK